MIWTQYSHDLLRFEFELSLPEQPNLTERDGVYRNHLDWTVHWHWSQHNPPILEIGVCTSAKRIDFPLYPGLHNYDGYCILQGRLPVVLILREFAIWIQIPESTRRVLTPIEHPEPSLEDEFFGRIGNA